MSKKVSGRYEFEIISPDGQVRIVEVSGSGFSEGGAFVDGRSAAGLRAADMDDRAHLDYGTHKVGRGRRVEEWR